MVLYNRFYFFIINLISKQLVLLIKCKCAENELLINRLLITSYRINNSSAYICFDYTYDNWGINYKMRELNDY